MLANATGVRRFRDNLTSFFVTQKQLQDEITTINETIRDRLACQEQDFNRSLESHNLAVADQITDIQKSFDSEFTRLTEHYQAQNHIDFKDFQAAAQKSLEDFKQQFLSSVTTNNNIFTTQITNDTKASLELMRNTFMTFQSAIRAGHQQLLTTISQQFQLQNAQIQAIADVMRIINPDFQLPTAATSITSQQQPQQQPQQSPQQYSVSTPAVQAPRSPFPASPAFRTAPLMTSSSPAAAHASAVASFPSPAPHNLIQTIPASPRPYAQLANPVTSSSSSSLSSSSGLSPSFSSSREPSFNPAHYESYPNKINYLKSREEYINTHTKRLRDQGVSFTASGSKDGENAVQLLQFLTATNQRRRTDTWDEPMTYMIARNLVGGKASTDLDKELANHSDVSNTRSYSGLVNILRSLYIHTTDMTAVDNQLHQHLANISSSSTFIQYVERARDLHEQRSLIMPPEQQITDSIVISRIHQHLGSTPKNILHWETTTAPKTLTNYLMIIREYFSSPDTASLDPCVTARQSIPSTQAFHTTSSSSSSRPSSSFSASSSSSQKQQQRPQSQQPPAPDTTRLQLPAPSPPPPQQQQQRPHPPKQQQDQPVSVARQARDRGATRAAPAPTPSPPSPYRTQLPVYHHPIPSNNPLFIQDLDQLPFSKEKFPPTQPHECCGYFHWINHYCPTHPEDQALCDAWAARYDRKVQEAHEKHKIGGQAWTDFIKTLYHTRNRQIREREQAEQTQEESS